jgi:hypothetical protein
MSFPHASLTSYPAQCAGDALGVRAARLQGSLDTAGGNPEILLARLADGQPECPMRSARLRRNAAGKAKAFGHDGRAVAPKHGKMKSVKKVLRVQYQDHVMPEK